MKRNSTLNNRVVAALAVISCVLFLSPSARADKKDLIVNKGAVIKGAGAPNGGLCASVDGNIVTNCGFESGDFAPGWSYTGDPTYVGVSTTPPPTFMPYSGAYAAFFGPIGDLGCISQSLITPAFYYDFSAYFANTGIPNELQIWWDGAIVSDSVDLPDFPYTFGSLSALYTPGNPTELKLCFRNDPSYIDIDDIVVTETPASPKK
jgi:hypothetical protein